MNKFLGIFFRLGLIFLGVCFFIFLVFLFLLALILFGIKQLWWKITGQKQENTSGFRFNPKDGFTYFYSRAASHENTRGTRSREFEDITDVEVKQVQPPQKNEPLDSEN